MYVQNVETLLKLVLGIWGRQFRTFFEMIAQELINFQKYPNAFLKVKFVYPIFVIISSLSGNLLVVKDIKVPPVVGEENCCYTRDGQVITPSVETSYALELQPSPYLPLSIIQGDFFTGTS